MASAPLPQNDAAFTLEELLAVTGARLSPASGGAPGLRVERVVTDSRADVRGAVFVALRGERFDGHEHAAAAVRAGARAVVAERELGELGVPVLVVPSALSALGALARAHRRRSRATVVAIAGSAGKTTTRSAVGAVLELVAPGAVHQTAGNLNNLIGVPLVLLALRPEHRFAVVELGTNLTGEVERLMGIAEPDAAVLTLIGIEHSEGLGDLDGIEAEEGAAFRLLAPAAVAVGNGDDARVSRQLASAGTARHVGYGFGAGLAVRAVARELADAVGQRLTLEGRFGRLVLDLPLLGEAGAYAALAAVAVLDAIALPFPSAPALSEALGRAGEPGRLQAHRLGDGTIVLDDAYNANPASARSSLRCATEVAASRSARLVLVLGEMRELGAVAAREHAALGAAIGATGAALLIAVGGDARLYVDPARAAGVDAYFADDAEAALAAARSRVQPGDVVLVKASRGVRAERVVQGLLERGAA
jgi:UDP-N-acetylmuramoyl-tripeptide--D-alanyl-D-alanine ligase